MNTRTIEVETADGPMEVYEVIPDTVRGGVVVVQEAFGVNDHIQDVTRRVAELGYHSVAPHFFHRAGGGVVPYGDFAQVLPKFEGLSDEGILHDVDAGLAVLAGAGIGAERTAMVGFCFGGRVSFLTALRRGLGAAVSFYGGGIVSSRFPQFPSLVGDTASRQTPWLGFFGDDDPSIPVDEVEQIRAAVKSATVDAEVVRYAGAGHGFFRDVSDDYRPEASKDAWQRLQDWFDSHLT